MKEEQRIYIKGDVEKGEEIIKILTDLGGYNTHHYHGNNKYAYYFISPKGVIDTGYPSDGDGVFSYVKEFYREFKLPRWKPEYEGSYYFINDRGKITPNMWENTNSDDLRYELGNCFRTPQEAETARDKIKEFLKK